MTGKPPPTLGGSHSSRMGQARRPPLPSSPATTSSTHANTPHTQSARRACLAPHPSRTGAGPLRPASADFPALKRRVRRIAVTPAVVHVRRHRLLKRYRTAPARDQAPSPAPQPLSITPARSRQPGRHQLALRHRIRIRPAHSQLHEMKRKRVTPHPVQTRHPLSRTQKPSTTPKRRQINPTTRPKRRIAEQRNPAPMTPRTQTRQHLISTTLNQTQHPILPRRARHGLHPPPGTIHSPPHSQHTPNSQPPNPRHQQHPPQSRQPTLTTPPPRPNHPPQNAADSTHPRPPGQAQTSPTPTPRRPRPTNQTTGHADIKTQTRTPPPGMPANHSPPNTRKCSSTSSSPPPLSRIKSLNPSSSNNTHPLK